MGGLWQAVATLLTIGIVCVVAGVMLIALSANSWRPALWGLSCVATGAIFIFITVVMLTGGTISRAFIG